MTSQPTAMPRPRSLPVRPSCSETESFGRLIVSCSYVRLFGFDLAGAGDRRPVRDLVGNVLAELLWRHRHDGERFRIELVAQLGRGEDLVDFLVELLRDGIW